MLAHPNRAKVWQVNVQQEITVTHQPDNTLTLAGLNSESEAILVEFAPDETRGLLPTGNVVDLLCGGAVRATLVLGSNPTVVVPMEHLAGPHDLERLRSEGASRMKVPCNDAVRVAFVSTATPGAGCDLRVQITVPPGSARTFHHAITGTGAANLAVASLIPGTVCHVPRPAGSQLTIAHPSGAMQIGARVKHTQQVGWCSLGVSLVRTARVLMRGRVFG